MKIKTLILALITISFSSISQENNDSLKITQFNIKTSPLTLVDPLISSAQLALEYRHNHKYGVEASYYFKTPAIFSVMRDKQNEKLVKYKAEFRKFFQDELYLGLEYGHIDYSYDYEDDHFNVESVNNAGGRDIFLYNYESASYQKVTDMINLKFGIEYNSRKYSRLLFDFFIGVGARRTTSDYFNIVNAKKVTAFPQDDEGHSYGYKQPNGTYILVDDEKNPPSDATDLGKNVQGVINEDETVKVTEIKVQAWDLLDEAEPKWKGNFTFGIKIGYTLWSKYKY